MTEPKDKSQKSKFLKTAVLLSAVSLTTTACEEINIGLASGGPESENNTTEVCDIFSDSYRDEATVVNGYQLQEDGYYKVEGNLIIEGDVRARFVTIEVENGDVHVNGSLARNTSIYNETNINDGCDIYGDLFNERPTGTVAGINVTGHVGSGSYLDTNGSIDLGSAAKGVEMRVGRGQTITVNGTQLRQSSINQSKPSSTL